MQAETPFLLQQYARAARGGSARSCESGVWHTVGVLRPGNRVCPVAIRRQASCGLLVLGRLIEWCVDVGAASVAVPYARSPTGLHSVFREFERALPRAGLFALAGMPQVGW